MIGIHESKNTFSDRWIAYCTDNCIPFRRINCLSTDVVNQCEGLDGVLWHWEHSNAVNSLVALAIIASLEAKGVFVFPNVNTCWHYDDKIAQKYLFEAIGVPFIPTWIFTNKVVAMRWIDDATWPKVFKLRCGAGSSNVRLVRSRSEATTLCRQAFGRGFPAVASYLTDMQTRLRKTKNVNEFWLRVARAPRTFYNIMTVRRKMHREQGYLYFQEFLPDNAFDTRITIIGDRAFGFVRANRPNDFRASGSGSIQYDPAKIDIRCVDIAFQTADRLCAQSLAFDFVYNALHQPLIIEISYCYKAAAVHACAGHWDRHGVWHAGHIWPEEAILEDLLGACCRKSRTAQCHSPVP